MIEVVKKVSCNCRQMGRWPLARAWASLPSFSLLLPLVPFGAAQPVQGLEKLLWLWEADKVCNLFGALGEKVTLKKSKTVNLQLEDEESRQTPCRTGPAAGPEALTPTYAATTTTRKGLEPYTEKLDLYPGGQRFSKCDSGTSCRSITWELNRNTNSWDHPRPSESITGAQHFVLTSPPGDF